MAASLPAVGTRPTRKGLATYILIERRRLNPERAEETMRPAQSDLIPKLQQDPGFVSSYVAVVARYADGNGSEARVIWPDSISLTRDNAIRCRGDCTLRKEFRTFRLDRMIGCYALSTPDDCESAAQSLGIAGPEHPAPPGEEMTMKGTIDKRVGTPQSAAHSCNAALQRREEYQDDQPAARA
jgi:hypothetical protein